MLNNVGNIIKLLYDLIMMLDCLSASLSKLNTLYNFAYYVDP